MRRSSGPTHMLKFNCEQCNQKIKVQVDRRGQRIRCPRCRVAQVVPDDAIDVAGRPIMDAFVDDHDADDTADGTIYLHQPPQRHSDSNGEDDQGIGRIVEHVEQHIGQVKTVLHELNGQRMSISIQYIPPASERPFSVLTTLGMSAEPMAAPQRGPRCDYAELLLALPPDWPMTQEAFARDKHHWPIKMILALARRPHELQAALDCGVVVPNGDPPEPFAPSTELCGSILMAPTLLDSAARCCKVAPDKQVQFFGVVPLFQTEMDLADKRGANVLSRRLAAAGVNELLDPNRPKLTAKRFGIF
jgi:hypothetical protein